MKVLLICPSERPQVRHLSEEAPLSVMPILGQSLLEYWLAHIANSGGKQVLVLAHDRAAQVLQTAGDGTRWGLQVEVIPESRELSAAQALLKYSDELKTQTIKDSIFVLDTFPGASSHQLFDSYETFFRALQSCISKALTPERIGFREITPGVYVGRQAHIASDAKLIAPCWIGQHTFVGSSAVVGPDAIIEDGCFVEPAAVVRQSYIGPNTFIGRFAELSHSLAWGNTLVNWQTGSAAKVPDHFLLCALRSPGVSHSESSWLNRISDLCTRRGEALMIWKHLLMNKES